MRRTCFLVVTISIFLSGCGLVGGSAGAGATPFAVANAFNSIQAGTAAVMLKASDAKGPMPVSWSLADGTESCSPGCGTLASTDSFSATYTPPTDSPSYGGATITATSTRDGRNSFTFDFQILAALKVKITEEFKTATAGSSPLLVVATVPGDPKNGGVTWTLTAGGSSCAPGCGTLTPGSGSPVLTASYQPPATVPSGANASPTITATSVTNTSKSDSFAFTIVSALGRLQGSYSLLLRGYDLAGNPMAMGGSITADGQGAITGGEFDVNNSGGITRIAGPLAGSYSIDASFSNATRGRITISNYTFPGTSIGIAFDFALSADGKRGRAVESDGTGYINTGTFLQQDGDAIEAGTPAGKYAFQLDSDAPIGGRIVEAGRFDLAGGVVSNGIVDQSKAGNITPTYSGAAIDSGSATSPDSSGRGTLMLTVGGNSSTYAYYIVNANQLNLIQIDRALKFGTTQAGVARVQKMPFTAESVNTTSVLQLTGMDAIPGSFSGIGPDSIIGILTIANGNQFSLTFDENDLGTVLTSHPGAGTISFDPATGRGSFIDEGGFESGFMDSAVFYLYDAGAGFVIDSDISTCAPPPPAVPPGCVIVNSPGAAITNNAFSGTFVPQVSGPFKASSINGNLIGGSGATAIPNLPDMEIVATVDDATGAASAVTDLDSLASQSGSLRNLDFGGTFLLRDPKLGHGSAALPQFIFGNFIINPASASFYLIGPNQFVLIGTQPGLDSGVSFFDPE